MRQRWSRYTDGKYRVELRVPIPLTGEEMAELLAAQTEAMDAAPAALTAPLVREYLANELRQNGLQALSNTEPTDDHRDAVRRAYGPEPTS